MQQMMTMTKMGNTIIHTSIGIITCVGFAENNTVWMKYFKHLIIHVEWYKEDFDKMQHMVGGLFSIESLIETLSYW